MDMFWARLTIFHVQRPPVHWHNTGTQLRGQVVSGEEDWTVTYRVEGPAGHFAEHDMSVPFATGDIVIALEFAQREIPKEYPNTLYEVIRMVRGDGSGIRGRLEAVRPDDSL